MFLLFIEKLSHFVGGCEHCSVVIWQGGRGVGRQLSVAIFLVSFASMYLLPVPLLLTICFFDNGLN